MGVSMILDTLVFLPATSTAEMDVVEKEQINQDGSGQTLLPHSFLLTPGFVNTWWCNSWNHLQHCACASQCTHLVMGHFCPVNVYKLHLKSPCVHLVATLWLCLLGQPQENTECPLLQLLCQSGESKHVHSSTAPWVLFQLPCSCLAYHGFSKQWDTARQMPLGQAMKISEVLRFLS